MLKVNYTINEVSFYLIYFKDIECEKLPPSIPSDPEYSDSNDDGHMFIDKINYPSGDLIHTVFRSDRNNTEIPRNYMANLT